MNVLFSSYYDHLKILLVTTVLRLPHTLLWKLVYFERKRKVPLRQSG